MESAQSTESLSGYLTTGQVAAQFGVTVRQLQWWDEQGLVSPLVEGHRRIYSQDDARLIASVVRLRRARYSIQQIRALVSPLRRRPLGACFAVVVGAHVTWCDSQATVLDVIRNAAQPSLLLAA